jgi:hypothetical protein
LRFRFDIHGSMDIDTTATPANADSELVNFNQLRIRVGSESVVPFREEQISEGHRGFATFVISDPIMVDLSNPGELSVEWIGTSAIAFMDGDVLIESLFANTASLTAVEIRDLGGNLIDAVALDDEGRSIVVSAVPIPGALLLIAGAMPVLTRIRSRRNCGNAGT